MQVVIALIVTPDGFPLGYEVLPGNTADSTTLRDMLRKIEAQYGKANRIWVMDRGIPTEEVLAEMRAADPPVSYLVGTPKGRLSKLEKHLVTLPWQAVREGVDVKLLPQDQELYVLAQSHARIHKERAMRRRKLKWLWARLKQIAAMDLDREELLMKLGAARAKARAAWRLVDVEVAPEGATFSFTLDRAKLRQVRRREGRYLLRTNLTGKDPAELWRFYIQLVEIEAAFKTMKDDLQLRPIYHQLEATHRGAHLRRLPGLLSARHAARPAQAAGARPHSEGRARQVRRHSNARRAFPDHRRPHPDPQSLHRTHRRPKTSGPATQTRSAATAAATHHRARKDRSPPSQRRVVETFAMPPLILLTFFAELGKLG